MLKVLKGSMDKNYRNSGKRYINKMRISTKIEIIKYQSLEL